MSALRTKELSGPQGSLNKIVIDDINSNIKIYVDNNPKLLIDSLGVHPSIHSKSILEYSVYVSGEIEPSKNIFQLIVSSSTITLPETLADSKIFAGVDPTNDIEFSIKKNGIEIGKIDYDLSLDSWSFIFDNDVILQENDILSITSPSDVFGLSNLSITIIATKG